MYRLVPPNALLIADPGVAGRPALLYSEEPSVAEPIVVQLWDGVIHAKLARSFRNYIYSQAYFAIRFPPERLYGPPRCDAFLSWNAPARLPEVQACLTNLGLEARWFSDDFQFSMDSTGRAVVARPQSGEVDFLVSCARLADAAAIKASLMERFPFQECM